MGDFHVFKIVVIAVITFFAVTYQWPVSENSSDDDAEMFANTGKHCNK